MADDFSSLGYSVLRKVLTGDEIENARKKVEALYAAGKHDARRAKGDVVITNLQAKDPWFIGLLEKAVLEAAVMPLLNDPYYPGVSPDQPNYIVGEFIARSSGPRGLGVHMDAWMPSEGALSAMVQIVIALEDRGREEGCTHLLPGSHVSGKDPYTADLSQYKFAAVPLRAGDAVLVDSRIWHGAEARTSDKMGWALVMTFQRWWVRQRFNIPATLSPELKSQLTVRQLALLGCYATAPVDEYEEGYNGEYRKLHGSPL